MATVIGTTDAAPAGDPGKDDRLASGIPVVPAFDGFRAYAILGIVALHILIWSGLLGALGEDLFFRTVQATLGQAIDVLFVVSGFVVFLPTVARHGHFGGLRGYAIRRAARLVPAYWVISAIGLVLIAAAPLTPPVPTPGLGVLAVHAGFMQTPAQLVTESVPIGFGLNPVVWTLSVEATFYLLLPLIAGWYFRRPLIGLAVAAVLTAAWHEAFLHFTAVTDFLGLHLSLGDSLRVQASSLTQFPFFAFSFAAGMTGAWYYVRLLERHPPDLVARRARPVALGAAVALAAFVYLVGHNGTADVLLGAEAARRAPWLALGYSGSLATLMVALALAPPRWQWPFANRLLRGLGDAGYGIFLVHMLVVTYALHALRAGPDRASTGLLVPADGTISTFLALTAIVVPVSVAYGWASARYLEQPIRRWARRYGRRRERAPV